MTEFQCRSCHRAVTPTVTERSLPDPDVDEGWYRPEASPPDASGHSTEPIVRMPPGTFAVDPNPSGPPYVLDESSGFLIESGPSGTIVLNPGDGLGLEEHPDIAMRRGYCCGMDGEWRTPAPSAPATLQPSWPASAISSGGPSGLWAGSTPPAPDVPLPTLPPSSNSTASHDQTEYPGMLRGPDAESGDKGK